MNVTIIPQILIVGTENLPKVNDIFDFEGQSFKIDKVQISVKFKRKMEIKKNCLKFVSVYFVNLFLGNEVDCLKVA